MSTTYHATPFRVNMPKEKFWRQGLKFECHQCGHCCTFPGGVVNATEREFRKIAVHLDITYEVFLETYTENSDGFITLKSPNDGPCVFYEKGCSIYSVRPTQCRTFPFWPDILKSKKRWDHESTLCCGMDKGKEWSEKEIDEQSKANDQELLKARDG